MSLDPHDTSATQSVDDTSLSGAPPLKLGLHLSDGHAVVQGHNLVVGPFALADLSLAIPDVTFPFDVSGGAERFKNHRCHLQHLEVRLAISALNALWAQIDWAKAGLGGVRDVHVRHGAGGLQLAGLYAAGERMAPFTCRVAIMPAGPAEVRVMFYMVRLFGLWPLPGALLPMALAQALPEVPWAHCVPGAVSLRPGAALLRALMPQSGWRIPDLSDAYLTALTVDAQALGFVMQACAASSAEAALSAHAVAMPHAAQAALSAMASFAEAEAALGRGAVDAAFAAYGAVAGKADADPWVTGRLLTLGLGHQAWFEATEKLARQVLPSSASGVDARLALANLALARDDVAVAAAHFDALVQQDSDSLTPLDKAAASIASASAIRGVDPARALASLGRGMAQAPGFGHGFGVLLAWRRQASDRNGALEAGASWLEQAMDDDARAQAHIDLGQLQLSAPPNTTLARHHFDAALSTCPQATGAWQGLAEAAQADADSPGALAALGALADVYSAQGAHKEAAQAYAQAAELAAQSDAEPGAVKALWQAALRFWPAFGAAHVGFAEYVDALGEAGLACRMYDAVMAHSLDDVAHSGAPVRRSRLARCLRRRVELDRLGALGDAHTPMPDAERTLVLERALTLAPDDDETRACLVAQLRETGSHLALARLLAQTASVTSDLTQARTLCLEACHILTAQCEDFDQARPLLEALLEGDAQDDDAFAMLECVLSAQHDTEARITWLRRRAQAAGGAERAGALFALAQAQRSAPYTTQHDALSAVLTVDAGFVPAAQALVDLTQADGDAHDQARAFGGLAAALASADASDTQQAQARALLAQAQTLASQADDDPALLAQAQAAAGAACQAMPACLDAWTTRVELAVASRDWPMAQGQAAAAQVHLTPIDAFALRMRLAELACVTQDGFAMARAISDARALAQDLPHSATVAQIVRSFLQRTKYPCHPPQLLSLLRDVGLQAELIEALDKSLTQSPSCDDGRFAELMRLLIDCDRDVPRALGWCHAMCQNFPQEDAPWHRHVDILLHHPDLASPTPVFQAWAARREGRDRAIVLEAFSAYLQGQNNTQAALRVLMDACRAQPKSHENKARCQVLVQRFRAAQDYPQLAEALQIQAGLCSQGAERDPILRSLADVASEQLDDLPRAIRTLERLEDPNTSDALWCAGMLVDTKAFARLADDAPRLAVLPAGQRLGVAQALAEVQDTARMQAVVAPLLVHPRYARDAWALYMPPEPPARGPADETAGAEAVADQGTATAASVSAARTAVIRLREQVLQSGTLSQSLVPYLTLTLAQERWTWEGRQPDMAALAPVFEAVIWSETDTAWAAFVVSRAAPDGGAWPARAARALCDTWPADAQQLAAPLQVLLTEALMLADARLAVALSRRVLALNSQACEGWLVDALRACVPEDEVCRLLLEHCDKAGDAVQRARLTLRAASIKLDQGALPAAEVLLDAQPEAARTGSWAAQAFALGERTGDTKRQVAAAKLAITHADSDGDAAGVQAWSQTLAELYVLTDAPGQARALLHRLWQDSPTATGAFAQWKSLVAECNDAKALAEGLGQRLTSLNSVPDRLAALRLVTTAWATLPGAYGDAAAALLTWAQADLDDACVQSARRMFAAAEDAQGLCTWLTQAADTKNLGDARIISLRGEAALIAADLGDEAWAQALRLDAIAAGDVDATHLDLCIRYAQSQHSWPDDGRVKAVLMDRLAAQSPQAPEPLQHRIAICAAAADKHAQLEAHLVALDAIDDAEPEARALAHVQLAVWSMACDAPQEAIGHWLSALQSPAPKAAWFRHAQAHCVDSGDAHDRARLASVAFTHLRLVETQASRAAADVRPWWRGLYAHALAYADDAYQASQAQYVALAQAAAPWAVWAALGDDAAEVYLAAEAPSALLDLYHTLLPQAPDATARAALWWATGCAQRDAQQDLVSAQASFEQATREDPAHVPAQTDLGLCLVAHADWAQATAVLAPLVGGLGVQAPRPAMLGLLKAYEATGAHAHALRLCGTLMARSVDDGVDGEAGLMLRQARSRCLVALSRGQEAEMQWRDYLGSLPDEASSDLRAGALCALGALALARGDKALARAHLEHATALEGASPATRMALIAAWLAAEEYNRVVAMRLREAETARVPEKRAQHLLAAAQILEDHLGDKAEANWLLEQACEATPQDPGLLARLMGCYADSGETSKKLLTAERLMTLFDADHFGADFYHDLAQDYAEIDPVRAVAMAKRALAFDADHRERQAMCRALYARAGDWRAYVDLEQGLVPALEDAHERGPRSAALAEVYLTQMRDTARGLLALQIACEAEPDNIAYLRRRAAVLAEGQKTFPQATQAYAEVLQRAPTDTTTLRILARLTGAQGLVDRAYGYYACLLCLVPEDAEAERFVLACRKRQMRTACTLGADHVSPKVLRRVPEGMVGLLKDVGMALYMAPSQLAEPQGQAIVQSVHCDIAQTLSALMRMRGLDDAAGAPQDLIAVPGEARDLFVFAQSPDYFALRQDLGVAMA